MQLKVVEGEGAEYHTGSRATRGLTVLVTDEAGKPVQDAAVSFRLPDSGATGTFNSGLRTEIVKTGPNGRAVVWGMRWSDTPGTVDVHITAVKDQARSGIVTTLHLTDAVVAPAIAAGNVPRPGGEGEFKARTKALASGSGSQPSRAELPQPEWRWAVRRAARLRRPPLRPRASPSGSHLSPWGIRK